MRWSRCLSCQTLARLAERSVRPREDEKKLFAMLVSKQKVRPSLGHSLDHGLEPCAPTKLPRPPLTGLPGLDVRRSDVALETVGYPGQKWPWARHNRTILSIGVHSSGWSAFNRRLGTFLDGGSSGCRGLASPKSRQYLRHHTYPHPAPAPFPSVSGVARHREGAVPTTYCPATECHDTTHLRNTASYGRSFPKSSAN
jgi:hypothetical protein